VGGHHHSACPVHGGAVSYIRYRYVIATAAAAAAWLVMFSAALTSFAVQSHR